MIRIQPGTFAAAALCALMLVDAGCTRRESAGVAHKNELTIPLLQEPLALNPLLLEGPIAYVVSELFYTYLTNYDSAGNVVPDVALQVPTPRNGGVSRDGRRITFHLRRGVQWQDGAPLTAADVVFTYRAIMSPDNALPERYGYDQIASITAPDDYTVVITLRRAFSPIVPLFFGGDSNYPILPAHVLARYSSIDKVPFNQAPIGSGPYMLVSWKHGDRLELQANPRYYRGEPAIRRLNLPFIHDPSTTINELVTGEIDGAFFLDASRISQLRSLPSHRVLVTPIPGFYAIAFNTTDPVLGNVDVRRALALAIDRDTIVRKVSHDVYDAQSGLRGLFTWAYNPRADDLRYDPGRAAALLDRAGWKRRADGTRWRNGKQLQLQLAFPAGSDITAQLATAIAAAETSVGVDVSLKRYAREVYMANDGPVMQGRFQMNLYGYQSQYDPDAAWLYACNQRSPGGFNEARYCNPSVDASLARASAIFDRPARRATYAQIQQRVLQDLPYFFLAQTSEIDVIPSGLQRYERPLLSPFNSVARWSLGSGRVAWGGSITSISPTKKRRM